MLLNALALLLAPATDIDLTLAKQYFVEAQAASDRDGGKLWGKAIVGPMLFADPETKECVANEPDPEHKLTAKSGVWIGKLPSDTAVSNTSITFGGTAYAMVRWPLPKDKPNRVSLMIHESWHRIQESLGLPNNSLVANYFGETDARILLRLEMRALGAALEKSGADSKEAANDAVWFRALRNAEFEKADACESGLERHEGLAEYTGDRLGFTDDKALVAYLVAELRDFEKEESMGRSFPYRTGPVYGVLLDRFRPTWRKDLKSGKGLSELLAEALHTGPANGELVTKAAAKYDGDTVRKEEVDRAADRAAHLQALEDLLVKGPVLDIPLDKPKMSFDPGTLFSLGPDGEAYGVLKLIDTWGTLDVKGGVGLLTNWRRLRAGLPDGFNADSRSGKDWTLELNPGWKLVPGNRAGDWTVAKT